MEKRYVVPPEMINAFQTAMQNRFGQVYGGMAVGLEAAIRWLDGELEKMDKEEPFDRDLQIRRVRDFFLAPEPEVPEAIKDLLTMSDSLHNEHVLEAYRRGMADGRDKDTPFERGVRMGVK